MSSPSAWGTLKRKAAAASAAATTTVPTVPSAEVLAAQPPECAGCREYLLEPHVFGLCAHYLCVNCTASLLVAEHAADHGGHVRCPRCRTVDAPRIAQDVRAWLAAWFPDEQAAALDERAERTDPARVAAAMQARMVAAAVPRVAIHGTTSYTDANRVVALRLVDSFMTHVATVTSAPYGNLTPNATLRTMWSEYVRQMPRDSCTWIICGEEAVNINAVGKSAASGAGWATCYITIGTAVLFIFHAIVDRHSTAPINFAH